MIFTTRRFCTVRASLPMWPGIAWFFQDATRSLAHADRTDAAMEHGTVRGRTTCDTKALNNALEAFTLRDAADIDELTLGEGRDGNDVTHLEGRNSGKSELR